MSKISSVSTQTLNEIRNLFKEIINQNNSRPDEAKVYYSKVSKENVDSVLEKVENVLGIPEDEKTRKIRSKGFGRATTQGLY